MADSPKPPKSPKAKPAAKASPVPGGAPAPGGPAAKNEYKTDGKGIYYRRRVELFEKYKTRQDASVASAKAVASLIRVTLPDGKSVPGAIKGATTPLDVALSISKSLATNALVAKVDGEVWDMFRPLEGDCALQLCTYEDKDGQATFWHSAAHVLGQARGAPTSLIQGGSPQSGREGGEFAPDRVLEPPPPRMRCPPGSCRGPLRRRPPSSGPQSKAAAARCPTCPPLTPLPFPALPAPYLAPWPRSTPAPARSDLFTLAARLGPLPSSKSLSFLFGPIGLCGCL